MPKCGKTLSDNENITGKCFSCGKTFKQSLPTNSITNNSSHTTSAIGNILKIIGWIIICVGVICAIIFGNNGYGGISIEPFLIFFITGLISGLIILGFGEIINLLYTINQKLNK